MFVSPFRPVSEQQAIMFPSVTHPYRTLEATIDAHLTATSAILDIGCGRTAPNLVKLWAPGRTLYGIDLVEFSVDPPNTTLLRQSVAEMTRIASESIDLAYSRSVMEHVDDVDGAFREIRRVLRPGGIYVFLTPSFYDYASLIAAVVPNAWHPAIVRHTEGRQEEDVFPTRYKANTRKAVRRLADAHGLEVVQFDYLGQYPSYMMFNRFLFWMASQYQRFISSIRILNPLQGWILCVLRRPSHGDAGTVASNAPARRQ